MRQTDAEKKLKEKFGNVKLSVFLQGKNSVPYGLDQKYLRNNSSYQDRFDRNSVSCGETIYKTMPFGMYKDHELEDIPTDYLKWAVENLEDRQYKGLIASLEVELWTRPDRD